ncbi:hypothetical protein, partial [Streptomyces collinus]|uniref:hypothetical protein n=1 Tax=Streptomyces collinus TaxID=42684 RepID=UPI0033260D27
KAGVIGLVWYDQRKNWPGSKQLMDWRISTSMRGARHTSAASSRTPGRVRCSTTSPSGQVEHGDGLVPAVGRFGVDPVRRFGNGALVRTYHGKR